MGLFDDVSQFLESRIDEFLRNNPHLELQALEEKLLQQAQETDRLLRELRSNVTQAEQQILKTAQEIQRWHIRIAKAQAAGRQDLVKPAQAQEAALIRQGNLYWGQMELLRDRVKQTEQLAQKIQVGRQEVKAKVTAAQAARAANPAPPKSSTWSAPSWGTIPRPGSDPSDPLEQSFQQWEAQEELEQLKRNL